MKQYFQTPWSMKEVMLSVAAGLLLIVVMIGVLSLSGPINIVLLFMIQWVMLAAPILILTAKKYGIKSEHFGFGRIPLRRLASQVATHYLFYLGINVIISILILFADVKIPGYQIQETIIPIFGGSTMSLIVAAVIIVGVAPVLEEILFRGCIFRTLAGKLPMWQASIISALIFAIFHTQLHSAIPIFILGLILNSLVAHNRSLWPAIAFHMFNNAIAFTIEILVFKQIINLDQVM